MKQAFDFAIATDCEFDADFIQLLEQTARQSNLTTYLIKPNNLEETLEKFSNQDIEFRFYYDRASDTSPDFLKLYNLVIKQQLPLLDYIDNLNRAADKATMHLEFLTQGIQTPYTIIIPPVRNAEALFLSVVDISKLGRPFIIKPANTTGGGIGVVDGAESLQDVLQARWEFQNDKYLLQEKVVPQIRDGRRFWFRGFYVCSGVECSWWNDETHIYDPLATEDVDRYELAPLFAITRKIAQICKLNFFSTEIALNLKREFVVVDYVNEICDTRLQSRYPDGVSDTIAKKIAERIVLYVREKISDKSYQKFEII